MSQTSAWIQQWVEEHSGEREDGTWYIMGLDYLGEKTFSTQDALEAFLWDYAVENPDCYLPSVP